MKIERNNAYPLRLSSIEIGEVFEYNNVFYLKTDELSESRRTCVNLQDGCIDHFVDEITVYKREAMVVVE